MRTILAAALLAAGCGPWTPPSWAGDKRDPLSTLFGGSGGSPDQRGERGGERNSHDRQLTLPPPVEPPPDVSGIFHDTRSSSDLRASTATPAAAQGFEPGAPEAPLKVADVRMNFATVVSNYVSHGGADELGLTDAGGAQSLRLGGVRPGTMRRAGTDGLTAMADLTRSPRGDEAAVDFTVRFASDGWRVSTARPTRQSRDQDLRGRCAASIEAYVRGGSGAAAALTVFDRPLGRERRLRLVRVAGAPLLWIGRDRLLAGADFSDESSSEAVALDFVLRRQGRACRLERVFLREVAGSPRWAYGDRNEILPPPSAAARD